MKHIIIKTNVMNLEPSDVSFGPHFKKLREALSEMENQIYSLYDLINR